MEEDTRPTCLRHNKKIITICHSHQCDYYRQLCEDCQKKDHKHSRTHIELKQAIKQALKQGSKGLMGLRAIRARKNQQMQVNINNNPGLFEIETKIQQIRQLINEKIDNFHNSIKRIYSEHVKEKLDELDQIIQKSEQLLQKEVNELEKDNPRNLHIFFKNDFLYELNYFESYFNEIFVKKIRSFKTALENDRILTLVMNFQQNLERIFSFSKENNTHTNDHTLQQFHLLSNEMDQCYLYLLNKKMIDIRRKAIASMSRINTNLQNMPEGTRYRWNGIPQSIFYPPGNCYYIIGEGSLPSKLIVKYEYLRSVEEGFCNVKSMETERSNFGICILSGQVYIIGGQNEHEGCLSRCEKFVPLYNNQVYIIHSLKQRSSRHSVTTYKDKYILKFGGIRRIPPQDTQRTLTSEQVKDYMALPEIYSIETEEWSLIPFKEEFKLQFNCYPSFFKADHRNFLLILGGDPILPTKERYRPAFEITLEENKAQIEQIKIRVRQSKIEFLERIHNSSIAVEDEDHICVFLKSRLENEGFELGRLKIYL